MNTTEQKTALKQGAAPQAKGKVVERGGSQQQVIAAQNAQRGALTAKSTASGVSVKGEESTNWWEVVSKLGLSSLSFVKAVWDIWKGGISWDGVKRMCNCVLSGVGDGLKNFVNNWSKNWKTMLANIVNVFLPDDCPKLEGLDGENIVKFILQFFLDDAGDIISSIKEKGTLNAILQKAGNLIAKFMGETVKTIATQIIQHLNLVKWVQDSLDVVIKIVSDILSNLSNLTAIVASAMDGSTDVTANAIEALCCRLPAMITEGIVNSVSASAINDIKGAIGAVRKTSNIGINFVELLGLKDDDDDSNVLEKIDTIAGGEASNASDDDDDIDFDELGEEFSESKKVEGALEAPEDGEELKFNREKVMAGLGISVKLVKAGDPLDAIDASRVPADVRDSSQFVACSAHIDTYVVSAKNGGAFYRSSIKDNAQAAIDAYLKEHRKEMPKPKSPKKKNSNKGKFYQKRSGKKNSRKKKH